MSGWPKPANTQPPRSAQAIIVKPYSSIPALTLLTLSASSLFATFDNRQSTPTDIWSNSPRWTLSTLASSHPLLAFLILPTPLLSFKGLSNVFFRQGQERINPEPVFQGNSDRHRTRKAFSEIIITLLATATSFYLQPHVFDLCGIFTSLLLLIIFFSRGPSRRQVVSS